MKMIEKIAGKDLKDGDPVFEKDGKVYKSKFRCKKCNKLLAEIGDRGKIKIRCSRCKTINEN